ncbi:MAG: hypothetical protein ACE145_11180 [Terriglobia bacterium]
MNLLSQFLILGVAIGILAGTLVVSIVFEAWIWSMKDNIRSRAPLIDDRLPNPSNQPVTPPSLRGAGAHFPAMAATNHK